MVRIIRFIYVYRYYYTIDVFVNAGIPTVSVKYARGLYKMQEKSASKGTSF